MFVSPSSILCLAIKSMLIAITTILVYNYGEILVLVN